MPDQELAPLDIARPDGTLLVREVFAVVFYIRRPHPEVGAAIEAAMERFGALVSFSRLRYFADAEGEWQDLLEQDLATRLADQWGSFAHTINANAILRGEGHDSPDFYLRYSGNMRAGQGAAASCFRCWVPKAYWVAHRDELGRFADSMAADLPIGFGHAGPALVGSDQRRLQKLAKRHLAVDISDPLSVTVDIGDMAGGTFWTTYLGEALTTAMGGTEELRKALPEQIAIDPVATGKCRLRLGSEPILGDVNRREDVSAYRALATRLRAGGVLHVPGRVVYFQDDAGMADREAQAAWYLRFVEVRP